MEENLTTNQENVACVLEIELDTELFNKGVRDISYVCGQIAALASIGIDPKDAITYIDSRNSDMSVAENNLKVAEITANSSIECAKFSDMKV